MHYLALGDSISIDTYTQVAGGGAASQFARLVGATRFQNLTQDGRTTAGVLDSLPQITTTPDIITLTAGGNDFLQGAYALLHPSGGGSATWDDVARVPLDSLTRIADALTAFGCPVIINTVYDPTDGDDALLAVYGVGEQARPVFNQLNDGIRALARVRGFLLSDLETLFHGHGGASADPWLVLQIEPNHAGATAIARHWLHLFQDSLGRV